MTQVKICGLTQRRDADLAERAGASYLGVILASGPRVLDVERARAVLGPRRHSVQRVAVFGSIPVEELLAVSVSLDLDVLQLHGETSAQQIRLLRTATARTVWPVLRVDGVTLPKEAADLALAAGALVLDAQVAGRLGGTGVTLDWEGLAKAVAGLRKTVPGLQFVLAGGLREDNVASAIRLLSPDVVDVSSGVETAPGVKDQSAVERFVSAARAAKGIER